MSRLCVIVLSGVGTACMAVAGTSAAQTGASSASDSGLEEIIITAEHRVADVQDTAASISVRTGQALLTQGKYTLNEILEDVPGLSTGQPSVGTSDTVGGALSIRGMKANSGGASVAVYTDGVYNGTGGGYDIDRVEVLRGPQGTLYGRSATAGVVAMHTRDPKLHELSGDIAAELGSYDLRHYNGAINVPMGDVTALRVAANRYQRDGYDSAEGGALATTEARAKFLFQPGENFSVLAAAALQDNTTHTGGVVYNLIGPDSYVSSATPIYGGENRFRQYWAEVNWDLGAATLTYLPAVRTWRQDEYVNAYPIQQHNMTPFDRFVTHELRLASNSNTKLIWQAGVFHYDNEREHNEVSELGNTGLLANQFELNKRTKNLGIFAESTYSFREDWRLTAGVRYDDTRVHVDELFTANTLFPVGEQLSAVSVDDVRNFYNLTYKVRLEQNFTDKNLVYAMVSTGFLPGDLNITTGFEGATVSPFEEETLTSYEIGSKNRFARDRLQVNAAAYYYDYGGYQTSLNVSTNPASPSFATITVPMKMKGGEIEVVYLPTPADRLSLDYAYVDARFISAEAPAAFTRNVVQERLTGVPPHTLSFAYEHTFHLQGGSRLTLRGDATLRSAHDIDTISSSIYAAGGADYVRVDDEVIGNLNASWSSDGDRYAVTAYARNIGDKRYKAAAQFFSSNPADGSTTTQLSAPRTLGLLLSARY